MAAAADLGGPCLRAVEDGIVETDREQDVAFFPVFALERSFHFAAYPGAIDGVPGEDQHEFVVNMDRLLDA